MSETIKLFFVKHWKTILIAVLLFYVFGGVSGSVKLFESVIGKMFHVQINNALIQRVIPDGEDRMRFIDREYATEDQFESDYRQTTVDFRYKYPALREHSIRNKEQLADFTKMKGE